MTIAQSLLPEFDRETAVTRAVLERVPAGAFAWKPHEKSFSMGTLATHVANILTWTKLTLQNESYDVAPSGGESVRTVPAGSPAELLAAFDANVKEARAALEAAADPTMSGTWSLLKGGEVMLTLPRAAMLRNFVMNHLIHHRAQLALYLRMNDVPVPAIYGRSADEG